MFHAPLLGLHPATELHSDLKTARHAAEAHKMRCAAKDYVFATPGLVGLGDDPLVSHLLAVEGLGVDDVFVLRVSMNGRNITTLCVQTRVWHDADHRAALHRVKSEADELGTRCMLVPARYFRGTLRGSNARIIARARSVRYSQPQSDSIIRYVRAHRIVTIQDCVDLLAGHPDPVAVVLAHCASGAIELDRSQPLSPGSYVGARQAMEIGK